MLWLLEGGGDWWLVMVRRAVLVHLVVLLALVSLGACGDGGGPAPAVLSVSIDQEGVVLEVGASAELSVTVEAVGGASMDVEWVSDDDGVVVVSGGGVVTGISLGEASISATSSFDDSVSDSIWVTVEVDGGLAVDEVVVDVGSEGAVIEVSGGLVVRVPPGAIADDDRRVFVQAVDATGLDDEDEPVGLFGSAVQVWVDEYFEVRQLSDALEVSFALDPERLAVKEVAVAVRAPRGAWMSSAEPFWHVMPGFLSVDGDVISVRLYAVGEETLEFSLVRAPSVAGLRASHGALEGAARSSSGWADDVEVTVARGWNDDFGGAASRAAVAAHVREYALESVAGFEAMGFAPPRWERTLVWGGPYRMTVYHTNQGQCSSANGGYLHYLHQVFVCWRVDGDLGDADGLNATRFATRHEIFHAVQNAYIRLVGVSDQPDVVFIEGTATLAERSLSGEARRSPDWPVLASRRHDWAALADEHSSGRASGVYQMQDLFAFLLRSREDKSFASVVELMGEDRVSWASVDRALRDGRGEDAWPFDSVADLYWAFVRNQHFERFQSLGDESEERFSTFTSAPVRGWDTYYHDDRPACAIAPIGMHVPTYTLVWDDVEGSFLLRSNTKISARFALQTLAPISNDLLRIDLDESGRGRVNEVASVRLLVDGELLDDVAPTMVRAMLYPSGQDCADGALETGALDDVVGVLNDGPLFVLAANVDTNRSARLEIEVVTVDANESIHVVITPAEATVPVNGSQSFTASVAGASDAGVTWSATCGNISGGENTVTYTAPGSPGECVVRATSVSEARAWAEATVMVTAAPVVRVSVEPSSVTLPLNGTQLFTATVTDASNTGVTWSATCGSISGGGSAVTYTAPPTAGECAVTATSVVDSARRATASVTVTSGGADFEPAPSYISISNVSLGAASGGARPVIFDISWDESWRGPDRPTWVEASDNWDAAWVFVKYRVDGGAWQHATLASGGHDQPSGSVVDVPSDRVGAFIYRSSSGYGTFIANSVGLQWDYVSDGVPAGASVEVQPFGIEMVHVPQGSFSLGSGSSTSTGEFRAGGTSNTPFVVSSQSSIVLGDGSGQLMWSEGRTTGSPSGSTSASFPTGFGAFYVMKYQVTQGQYVDFLNTLTQGQAIARKYTGSLYRYAITGDSVGSYATSLPFVALNYVSWADGAAFADWAGLRPMTELEFEKAARGPLSPVANEYAWGSTSVTQATGLANAGTITEAPTPAGANANYYVDGTHPIVGPVRVGSFAAPGRSRRDAGAGFYGTLELSGNLFERSVTVGIDTGRAFTGAHGDGMLDGSGNANVVSWPGSTAVGTGERGGGWLFRGFTLQVSDRIRAATGDEGRGGNLGWRGARSAP